MVIRYDEMYQNLVCEDVPRRRLRSTEDRGSYAEGGAGSPADLWDGTKPHAPDGFVAKWCLGDSEDPS